MNMSGVNVSSRALHLAGLVLLEQRSPPGNVDETAVSIVDLLYSNGMGMLVRQNFNRLAPATSYAEDVVHADFQPFGDDGDALNLSRVDVLSLSGGYGFMDEGPLLPLLIEYGRFLDQTQAGAVLESSKRQEWCMVMFAYVGRAYQDVNEWILNDVVEGDFYNLLKALLSQRSSSPELDYIQAFTSVVHFVDTSPSKTDFGQVSAVFQKARQVLSHPQIAGLEVGSKVLVSFFLRYFEKDPRYKVQVEFLRRGGLPTHEDAVRALDTVQARNGPSQAPPVLAFPGVFPPVEVPRVSSPAPVQVWFDM
jgi:hypothetical protein